MSKTPVNSGDFEQGAVPQSSRRGFWSMLVVMLGFTFFSASMFAGGKLGAGMTFTGLLWAVLAGNLLQQLYSLVDAWRREEGRAMPARWARGRRLSRQSV